MSDSETAAAERTATPTLPAQRRAAPATAPRPTHLTPSKRADLGLAARRAFPPGEQAELPRPNGRPSPVAVLQIQATSRVPDLVPVRHGRMVASPFAFFRGAAALMARDLGGMPSSDLTVQLCGDAHLSNFRVFTDPERRLLFDVENFDETLPGPWEWDVKRLAASIVVAGRENGFDRKARRRAVRATVERYQRAMAEFAGMRELDVWYARGDVGPLEELLRTRPRARANGTDRGLGRGLVNGMAVDRAVDRLRAQSKLTEVVHGARRIKGDPPLLVPVADLLPRVARFELEAEVRDLLVRYGQSLLPDRRRLLERYRFVDMARKVVGVGGVGTRCWVVLLEGRDRGDPLFLQVKEAQPSVLAPFVPPHRQPASQGERVVTGQRLMQAGSDIFLGWVRTQGSDGARRDFYVRQLRDQKGSAAVEHMTPRRMRMYGELCGWTLARAHARSGDAIAISAYLGDDTDFSKAVADFAERYADRNEKDYAEVVEAVRAGRLPAVRGS